MKIVYLQYGGKSSLSKWIVSHFPEHRIYVEPFCGSCAVLIAKQKSHIEVVNDLDYRLINMYKTLRAYPKELAALVWATPYSPENWREGKTSDDALEDARLFIASGQQFYCGDGKTSTWAMDKSANPHKPKPSVWADYCSRILPFAARIKDTTILCEDALKTISRFKDNKHALIYVDPPYFGHENEYRFGVDYQKLVEMLRECNAKVLVSEYPEAAIHFPGWFTAMKETVGRARTGRHDIGAKQKVEMLFANFKMEVEG